MRPRLHFEIDAGGAGLLLLYVAPSLVPVLTSWARPEPLGWGARIAAGIAAIATWTLVREVLAAVLRAAVRRRADGPSPRGADPVSAADGS